MAGAPVIWTWTFFVLRVIAMLLLADALFVWCLYRLAGDDR